MKRIACCLLAAMLCLGLCSAMAESAEEAMAAKALEMAAAICECGQSDNYLSLFTGAEAVQAAARQAAQNIAGSPRRALLLQADAQKMLDSLGAELTDVPQIALDNMKRRLPLSMLMQLASQEGAETAAAISIMQLNDTFYAGDGLAEDAVIVLDFGTDTALACAFSIAGHGLSTCTALPIPFNETAQASLQALASMGIFSMREIAVLQE